MKHRSVIAFVIVAAALFSLPQLTHDLRELKGAVGTRLHRELLYAFLALPAGEPSAAVAPAASPDESLLASCDRDKAGAASAKSGRAAGRAEGRTAGKEYGQSAMIGDPKNDPINEVTRVEADEDEVEFVETPSEVKAASEVAMIIPPETGVDPRKLADALASSDVARLDADRLRVEAEGMRAAYNTRARFEAQGGEWQRATGEAVRQLNALPGAYEFRVLRDGSKVKVLKVRCGECPGACAPRPSRAPRQAPPAPVVFTSAEWAGE
jgi:hypothetical protein